MRISLRISLLSIAMPLLALSFSSVTAQERSQYQHWLELAATDQTFAERSAQIGRKSAFLEFLGEGSVVFRTGRGTVDALEEYTSPSFEEREISWKAHYVDVSRDGDLGLTAGPLTGIDPLGESDLDTFGHLVSVWRKIGGEWKLMADIVVGIPGFLSLEVEPDFEDTRPLLEETAHPVMAMAEANTLQSLIEADNRFGQNINFRGGQRALLRYGLENTRVYLPNMAAAVGAESASSVYGAYLDSLLFTTNPISLNYEGGYLSTSKEMGYTYGTMATTNESLEEGSEPGFRTSYLRLWRLDENNEWKIAVEMLRPI